MRVPGTRATAAGEDEVEDWLNSGNAPAKPPWWSESADDGEPNIIPEAQNDDGSTVRWLVGVGQHPNTSLTVEVCFGDRNSTCKNYSIASGSGVEVLDISFDFPNSPITVGTCLQTATVKETGATDRATTTHVVS